MDSHNPPPIPAAQIPQRPRRSPWKTLFAVVFFGGGALIILFTILMIVSVAVALKEAGGASGKSRQVTEQVIRDGGSDRIAHIDLHGVITGTSGRGGTSMVEDFAAHMKAAVDDDAVKAIVVRIKSPGGEVTASDRLHHIIRQANGKKPVVAYLDTIAASGGYYAACGSRHVMSHSTTFTGSIGVIMQAVKYGDLFDKVGVSMEIYKSGEMKDLLSGTRDTSPEEIALLNELIDETYDRFLEVVAENRGVTAGSLRGSPFTDGRIFSGKQGFDGGFVDSLGFIEDAYDKAAEIASITNPTVIRYQTRQNFFDLFDPFAAARSGRLEIDVSERLLPMLQSGVPLYLHADAL